jgi:hypothetical protein
LTEIRIRLTEIGIRMSTVDATGLPPPAKGVEERAIEIGVAGRLDELHCHSRLLQC